MSNTCPLNYYVLHWFFFFSFLLLPEFFCLISLSLCLQTLIIFWFFVSFLLLDIQLMPKNWIFWFFHHSGLELLVNDRLNTYYNLFSEQTFVWTRFWIYVEKRFGYAFDRGIFRHLVRVLHAQPQYWLSCYLSENCTSIPPKEKILEVGLCFRNSWCLTWAELQEQWYFAELNVER